MVAHAILRISYYLLTRKEMYVDLGEDYFDKQRQQSIVRHALILVVPVLTLICTVLPVVMKISMPVNL